MTEISIFTKDHWVNEWISSVIEVIVEQPLRETSVMDKKDSAKNMRQCAENVQNGAKNVRHGANNVQYGAKNMLHGAKNVLHGAIFDRKKYSFILLF